MRYISFPFRGFLFLFALLNATALTFAANPPKEPIVLLTREAKTTGRLLYYSSSYNGGSYIGNWLDKKDTITYNLNVEPGKYRMVINIVPDGGGSLAARIDGENPVRRPIRYNVSTYNVKPSDVIFGEIEIPKNDSVLSFKPESIKQERELCNFYKVTLTWVGPLVKKEKIKSPLEKIAEEERGKKEAALAKAGEELIDNLKGTYWDFFYSGNFTGTVRPLSFGLDGKIFFFNGTNYKAVDGRTIEISYPITYTSSTTGQDTYTAATKFRLVFSEDMGTFKSDTQFGNKIPYSGKLRQVRGAKSTSVPGGVGQ